MAPTSKEQDTTEIQQLRAKVAELQAERLAMDTAEGRKVAAQYLGRLADALAAQEAEDTDPPEVAAKRPPGYKEGLARGMEGKRAAKATLPQKFTKTL